MLTGSWCLYSSSNHILIHNKLRNGVALNPLSQRIICTSRVPVEGKSSVCVICMKYYRIIVLIIIIISLGQIISYMANTSRTHGVARMYARVHTHARAQAHPPPSPSRVSLFNGRCAPNHDEDTPSFGLFRWP